MSIFDGILSLGKGTNKAHPDESEQRQGVVGGEIDELELPITDDELILLTKQWELKWNESEVKKTWEAMCEETEKYWKGEQYKGVSAEDRPLQDNAIWEALETFLPQATRRNPEPVVDLTYETPTTPELEQLVKSIEHRLAELADTLKLRLKIKRVARQWAIYLLGVGKVGWSEVTQDLTLKIIRPKKLILDPDGVVDEDGYSGKFVGEVRRLPASILEKLAIGKKEIIEKLTNGKKGSDIQFVEWWTDEYFCWTVNNDVLLKKKNPNWNYGTEEKTEETVDEYGEPAENVIPAVEGQNHFPVPKMPFIFLSVYNLGKQPVDDTSPIMQNLSTQDLINKRLRQIDKNADSMNNGLAVSGDAFDKEQAKQAGDAKRTGSTIWVPTGNPNTVIANLTSSPLPSDVFNQLIDSRARLKEVFGVRGLTPSGIQDDKTVRGKILTKSVDTDRIGGGVSEYLEQFADDVYNWFYQLMLVYYPNIQGVEMPKIIISVKEGSLLPKDTAYEAQQAIELAMAGKMSLLDLYKKLEDPNPEEKAANVWLEVNAPQMLYQNDPRIQQVMMQMQAAAQQQAQMQQEQVVAEKDHDTKNKMMDHESKMQQLQAKGQNDRLLNQVKVQKQT